MKILGIGTDIIENKRISSLIRNKKFLERAFSKNEIKFSKNIKSKTSFFAENKVFVKTIGTGFRKNINLKDIEILNDKLGKPYYLKSSKINSIIKKRFKINKYNLFLSISDEKNYSIAFTILQN